MDKGLEERAIINPKRKSREFQETLRDEYRAELDRLMKNHFKKYRKDEDHPQAAQFIEEEFGGQVQEISATFFGHSVVSIGLFREETTLSACSGTTVQYRHKKIHHHHT